MPTYVIEFISGKDIDHTESHFHKFEAKDDESAISHVTDWVMRNSIWLRASNNLEVTLHKEKEGAMPLRVKALDVPDTIANHINHLPKA